MRMLVLVLPLIACCSSNVDNAKPLPCPMTIDELRAGPPPNNYGVDYSADFATGSAVCSAGMLKAVATETFQQCGSPYDLMLWSSWPYCGQKLVYDHSTGQLVAVLGLGASDRDDCGGPYYCIAGPSQFVDPMATSCTTVAQCHNP